MTNRLPLRGKRFVQEGPSVISELVAQSDLDPAGRVIDSHALRCTECAVPDKAVQGSKIMTVKEIRQINLEYQGMTLRDRGALDNRKIVVEVVLTSDVA